MIETHIFRGNRKALFTVVSANEISRIVQLKKHSILTGEMCCRWVNAGPGETPKCMGNVRRNSIRAYPGDALHLSCEVDSPSWSFNGNRLIASPQKPFTTMGGLVLLNVSIDSYNLRLTKRRR